MRERKRGRKRENKSDNDRQSVKERVNMKKSGRQEMQRLFSWSVMHKE